MQRQLHGYSVIRKLNKSAEDEAGFLLVKRNEDTPKQAIVYSIEEMKNNEIRDVLSSLHIAASLNHPNFDLLYDCFAEQSEGNLYVINGNIECEKLSEVVKVRLAQAGSKVARVFTEEDIYIIAAQLLLALKELHNRGLAFSFLTYDDVHLTEKGIVKLRGLHKLQHNDTQLKSGIRPRFCSPQLLMNSQVTKASNLFSVGVILFYMAFSCLPYDGKSGQQVSQDIVSGKDPIIPFEASADMIDLIGSLLQFDAENRHTVEEALEVKAVKTYTDIILREKPVYLTSAKQQQVLLPPIKYDPASRNLKELNEQLGKLMNLRKSRVLQGREPEESIDHPERPMTATSLLYTLSRLGTDAYDSEEEDDEGYEEEEESGEPQEEGDSEEGQRSPHYYGESAKETNGGNSKIRRKSKVGFKKYNTLKVGKTISESILSSPVKMKVLRNEDIILKGEKPDHLLNTNNINAGEISILDKSTGKKTLKSESTFGAIREFANGRDLTFSMTSKQLHQKLVPLPDLILKKPDQRLKPDT